MARLARIPWLLAPAAIVALAVWLDGTEMVFEDSETVNLNETGDSRTGDGTSTVRCVDGDLDSIQIALADGQDELLIESTGDNPITSASLGPGNDLIVLGTSSVPIYLNQITRPSRWMAEGAQTA